METAAPRSAHTFHIPVMGTGYTVDTPLRVAKYGISSVISLVDDTLVEQMRAHHARLNGRPYEEIAGDEDDSRARRITAYLDLIDKLVAAQVADLQEEPFTSDSDITRYFEMLPESPQKQFYLDMLSCDDPNEKERFQQELRTLAVPGSIDVNIMSKLDCDAYRGSEKLAPEFADAMAALRGYANSTLHSSIVFSAGMNPRLYAYIAQFDDFFPNENGTLKKKIILKVSDYRSALIQGKYLAKRGLWVSEFRIESGLNCGGHAFPTTGRLLGPILEEFRVNRDTLPGKLHKLYQKGLTSANRQTPETPYEVRVTIQGGIGTADEDSLMLEHYLADGTGWGTPFLLVPEVTNVDDEHLEKLQVADESEVILSDSSPVGVPFWNLRDSASEASRQVRVDEGKPGSVCPKSHVKLNAEFTKTPICLSSRAYQRTKLKELDANQDLSDEQRDYLTTKVLAKSCICHDLAGGATIKSGADPEATPAICPGPGIAYFSQIASLDEMIGHIYGETSLLGEVDRPHVFIKELQLYVDYMRKEMAEVALGVSERTQEYFSEFATNMLDGINYYRSICDEVLTNIQDRFLSDLAELQETIEAPVAVAAT